MWREILRALLAILVLVPGLALGQTGEVPMRLPESSTDAVGGSALVAEEQIDATRYLPAAAEGSDNSQFTAADQPAPTPVEQRLMAVEKELQDMRIAQDAQK